MSTIGTECRRQRREQMGRLSTEELLVVGRNAERQARYNEEFAEDAYRVLGGRGVRPRLSVFRGDGDGVETADGPRGVA